MAYLTIPDELDKRFAALAEKAHIPKDKYILRALAEFLEDQEDYLIALAAMERYARGEEKMISFEEVVKKLGLEEGNEP